MSRAWMVRIVIAVVGMVAFFLVTSIVYELVVAARWTPALPGDGPNRWALLEYQNTRRDLGSVFIAWHHFVERLKFPATRPETIMRALIAAGFTLAMGGALAVAALVTRKPTHHGNARFGTILDAEAKGLTAKRGLLLGKLNGALLNSDDPAHVLVVGPTRSGKGVSFVIPNGYLWRGSSVWFDPKRENFEAFGAHRQALGDQVFMFSPGERDTHRYNPLDYIRRDARMATDAAVVASFIVPEGTGSSEIWSRTGRQLLTAMIGYVVSSPRYEGQRHLRAVTNLTATGVDFLRVLTNIRDDEREFLPSWVVQGLNQFIALEKETRNSAFFNVSAALNPWTNDLVAAATAATDFDIAALRRQPMAIFIGCSVAQLDILRPVIKILIQQIHDVLMGTIPGPDDPLKVLVMIDEFRQLGKMESIVSKLTINAGYGFRMVLILQDLAQLDEVYGKPTRQTIASACQVKLFIRINDLETSEYVSEMLGSTTIEVRTPIIRAGQGLFGGRDKSVSYQEKALRTAEELRQMPADRAIVLVPNAPGFLIRKLAYYRDAPMVTVHRRVTGRRLTVPALNGWADLPLRPMAAIKAATAPAAVMDLLEPDGPQRFPGSGFSPAVAASAIPAPVAPAALERASPAPNDDAQPPEGTSEPLAPGAPDALPQPATTADLLPIPLGTEPTASRIPAPPVKRPASQTKPARPVVEMPIRAGSGAVGLSALLAAVAETVNGADHTLAGLSPADAEAGAAIDAISHRIRDHDEGRQAN